MRVLIKFLIGCFISLTLLPAASFAKGNDRMETAIFAGGCFWCMEADFDKLPGVIKVISGYTGGALKSPSYEQVSAGDTGHYEAVEVVYDPAKITYDQLLKTYWHSIDPTDAQGQFCDRGDQYRSVVFYLNKEQKTLDEKSKIQSGKFKEIATQILPAKTFYPAEEYHQNYHQKNPLRYKYYRYRCGRDQRINEVWGNA
jgi:peptide-methionine (S)-S-oxide reductase